MNVVSTDRKISDIALALEKSNCAILSAAVLRNKLHRHVRPILRSRPTGADSGRSNFKRSAVKVNDVNKILNRISNQRLRFNVRKTIQLAAEYHKYDFALQCVSRLVTKNSGSIGPKRASMTASHLKNEQTTCSAMSSLTAVERICDEIRARGEKAWSLETNAISARRVAVASNTASNILTNKRSVDRYGSVLLSIFVVDDSVQKYAQICDAKRESFSKDLTQRHNMAIGMRNEKELRFVVDCCRRSKRFPIHLLPPAIRNDFTALLARCDAFDK